MADQGAGSREHAATVREILARCGARSDCRIWPSNTGIGRAIDNPDRIIRFGLKGSADISGIYRHGVRIEIEVKTGAALQSKEQRAFQTMIESFGGLYRVVRNADDAAAWLDSLAPDVT
jgi:hypothetical protein